MQVIIQIMKTTFRILLLSLLELLRELKDLRNLQSLMDIRNLKDFPKWKNLGIDPLL